ncbi:hypothetical protein T440DRAFT_516563 [Plenodomus tracheiphilus IPT5]|uniref:Uncharacterized protein n=1 Tax=Plenodomus tracheiphilus IPT5 TaxID=1408161 RepID=A0A6A7BEC3_9PLEO|nr:hypothetical protein T440DRAFT_516563 [Plenodomus tracheiphilus IPT5]
MGIMNTPFFDRLAADPANSNISFIHNWPGSVETGKIYRHASAGGSTWTWLSFLKPIHWIMGHGEEEAGQRHLYIATTKRFGGRGIRGEDGKEEEEMSASGRTGSGLYILNYKCDVSYSEKALKALRAKGQQEVWDETMRILKPFL